jgi:cell division protein YceG involved in septum cleavage
MGAMSTERTCIMRKVIASLAAAGVLVAGAFVATSVRSTAAEAQTAEENTTQEFERPEPGSAVNEVLAELVEAGTINQSQADAVAAALEAKREEMKENRPEGRRGKQRIRRHIATLLEDGVISADEIAELPDGHPFKDVDGPLADELADGQITQEEWDAHVAERKAEREAGEAGGTGGDGA